MAFINLFVITAALSLFFNIHIVVAPNPTPSNVTKSPKSGEGLGEELNLKEPALGNIGPNPGHSVTYKSKHDASGDSDKSATSKSRENSNQQQKRPSPKTRRAPSPPKTQEKDSKVAPIRSSVTVILGESNGDNIISDVQGEITCYKAKEPHQVIGALELGDKVRKIETKGTETIVCHINNETLHYILVANKVNDKWLKLPLSKSNDGGIRRDFAVGSKFYSIQFDKLFQNTSNDEPPTANPVEEEQQPAEATAGPPEETVDQPTTTTTESHETTEPPSTIEPPEEKVELPEDAGATTTSVDSDKIQLLNCQLKPPENTRLLTMRQSPINKDESVYTYIDIMYPILVHYKIKSSSEMGTCEKVSYSLDDFHLLRTLNNLAFPLNTVVDVLNSDTFHYNAAILGYKIKVYDRFTILRLEYTERHVLFLMANMEILLPNDSIHEVLLYKNTNSVVLDLTTSSKGITTKFIITGDPHYNGDHENYSLDVYLEDGFLDDFQDEPVTVPEAPVAQKLIKTCDSNANWAEFDLARPLLKAINELGFTNPSRIQAKVIPVALLGKDVMVTAETGSGKTASFLIPLIQRLVSCNLLKPIGAKSPNTTTKAIVLVPTRELALQCYEVYSSLAKHLENKCLLLTGGVAVQEQEAKLERGALVIIATPGRMLDIALNSRGIDLDSVEIVILDEADRLLEMGFKGECLEILKQCNKNRQTMLFSATLNEQTMDLSNVSLKNPISIQMQGQAKLKAAEGIDFDMVLIPDEKYREAAVLYMASIINSKAIYFFATRKSAIKMGIALHLQGYKCAVLHGEMNQQQRFQAISRFSNGDANILVATEVAARGLDIENVNVVINVHVPNDAIRFVHRVGRCARMGKTGTAITLYIDKQRSCIKAFLKAVSSSKFKRRKLSTGTLEPFLATWTSLQAQVESQMNEQAMERELERAESIISSKDQKSSSTL
ncbi:bifunctional ATP-dependent RNA helicase DEAD-box [Babesia duncani]|uniref:Bifunctional ATP-dependent RNA helicase DEAD-box n=1 Tax=Babesia duncani TaxID=323732 RepID=A0AAD9UNZ7_9APIC|nr:bifunctional ATP-dependent RNA helicase DEAD-box [Babesia duncani]